jgi:putative membrane protein
MTLEKPKTADELAVDRTDLAVERTLMAAGRTLMGWIRTALSMISFGFTIYKFLQASAKGAEVGLLRTQGPRRIGLFLIALGTTCIFMGAIEYFATLSRLNRQSATRL